MLSQRHAASMLLKRQSDTQLACSLKEAVGRAVSMLRGGGGQSSLPYYSLNALKEAVGHAVSMLRGGGGEQCEGRCGCLCRHARIQI